MAILRGEDKRINVIVEETYVNSAGDVVVVPIDLTAFEAYIIVLYSEKTGAILEKYSKNPATGYVTIDETDPVNGEVQLWLDKTVTSVAPEGNVYAELKTSLTDADFSDGVYATEVVFPVDTIVPSITNLLIPPL